MRSMCGADAGCLAINYQSLFKVQGVGFLTRVKVASRIPFSALRLSEDLYLRFGRFRVEGLRFEVEDIGFRFQGLGFRVLGSGFRF